MTINRSIYAKRGASMVDRLAFCSMPEPNSGCWLWLGAVNATGYGIIGLRGVSVLAHRASYEAHVGPIPVGQLVCHKCDVRTCINPDHFFLGDNAANRADCAAKGRTARRGKGGLYMTAEKVRAIREDQRSLRKIATDYGVSFSYIGEIKSGKKWRTAEATRRSVKL
jgi:hypothetical protein